MVTKKDAQESIAVLLFSSALLGAGVVWVWQLYAYARYGVWHSFSMIDLFMTVADSRWLKDPADWVGVHKAMSWLNAGSGVFIAGSGLAAVLIADT